MPLNPSPMKTDIILVVTTDTPPDTTSDMRKDMSQDTRKDMSQDTRKALSPVSAARSSFLHSSADFSLNKVAPEQPAPRFFL